MKKLIPLLILGVATATAAAATPTIKFVYRVAAPGIVAPPVPVGHVSLAVASLAFGNQALNTSSAANKVLLTNDGNAPLTVSGVALDAGAGEFSVVSTCSAALAPAATCEISVTFAPTALGTFARNVVVNSDAAQRTSLISLSGAGVTPPGPQGTLVKIVNAQVFALALNAQEEPLYLNNHDITRVSSSGTFLSTAYRDAGLAMPSNCNALNGGLSSLAVDKTTGAVYFGGYCSGAGGYGYAALWAVSSSTYATSIGPGWGASANNNWVTGLAAANGKLYASFSTTAGVSGYQQAVTYTGGISALANKVWSSNMVVLPGDTAPYMMATSGHLQRYSSGTTWTNIGNTDFSSATGSYLAAGGDGFLYYVPQSLAQLLKIDPTTGATVKSWTLAGLSGALAGLQVNSSGTPFIATNTGVWRMD